MNTRNMLCVGAILLSSFFSLSINGAYANESKVERVLDAYMAAWATHDVKKISAFFAENVEWYDMPSDTTTKGKRKVSKAIINAFLANVPNMVWVKSGDVFVSGNTIIYEWIYSGTYNGDWWGTPIKNKPFSIRGLSTTTINRNGKISFDKDYYDMYDFQKQLGLIQ
jgi:steroid delta-isomerase-like uncharacterized protein